MKANKRMLIASIILTVASLGGAITGTVAWYEAANRLIVDNINISFYGEKDLYIGLSENEDEFVEELEEELEQNKRFMPVSSMYSSSWINAKEELPRFHRTYRKGNIFNESSYKETSLAEIGEGYVTETIYLYSSRDIIATIDKEKTEILPNVEANERKASSMADNEEEAAEILEDLNDVVKSLRISLLNPEEEEYDYQIIDPYKEDETIFCGPLDLGDDAFFDYYTDDVDGQKYEFAFGEYADKSLLVYDEASPTESGLIDESKPSSAFNARTYANVKHFNLAASIANGLNPAIEDSKSLLEADGEWQISLKAYEPKKLVFSLYVEGWDLDNTNVILDGQFDAHIAFKIYR